jgi:TusA-related sulfurtransferase
VNPSARIDVRPLACPLTWVRTRVALAGLGEGQALEVLLSEGEPLQSIPRSAELEGHRVAAREPWPEGGWRVLLVKGRAPAPPSWEP